MISGEQIQQAVERLVAAANPCKVTLFCSYARGDQAELYLTYVWRRC